MTAGSRRKISEAEELDAIQRASAGSLDAFNSLVLEYQNLAFSVARRLLTDEEEAADAVQESFIKAFRALASFKGGNFKSWLMRIVTNTSYDVLRSRKRRRTDNIDDLPVEVEYASSMAAQTESLQDHAERMELNALIERAIQTLPDQQRIVVMLCDVHGYSYEEIAEITDVPMGTVKSRINRGRIKVRDCLLQHPELLPKPFRPMP